MNSFLSVQNIHKQGSDGVVVSNASFDLNKKTKLGIAGETGSGKTTLMKIAAGSAQASSGKVYFKNEEVEGLDFKLLPGHPGIAYLSQHFELLNNYKVQELLDWANKLEDEEAQKIYKLCKVEHLIKRKTNELSGGEKQRIALAKLLVGKPELLILDEPYSNLDAIHKDILKKVVEGVSEHLDITIIMVSHDAHDLLSWADEIMLMQHGVIIQKDNPENIYYNPVNEYAASLFGRFNKLNATLLKAFGIDEENQNTFYRPNRFKINTENNGLPAIVSNVLFLGNHYETEVKTAYGRLYITTVKKFDAGDNVFIRMNNA